MTGEGTRRPVLRVVRGDPDDAELAALVLALVVAAWAATAPSGPRPGAVRPAARPGRWADPARRLGRTAPGPGGWASSALPR